MKSSFDLFIIGTAGEAVSHSRGSDSYCGRLLCKLKDEINEEREIKVLKKSVMERLNSLFIECFIYLKAPGTGRGGGRKLKVTIA